MTVSAAFTVSMTPAESLQPGGTARFELVKTWTGGMEGTSTGTMMTAGDPATGSAGYIAMEVFDGTVDGRRGTLVLQQLGAMTSGEPDLTCLIAPGGVAHRRPHRRDGGDAHHREDRRRRRPSRRAGSRLSTSISTSAERRVRADAVTAAARVHARTASSHYSCVMSTVVLPGSFDPFTLGHLDLARRAAALADTVIIAVSHNPPSKTHLLDLDDRQSAIAHAMADEGLAGRVHVRTLPRGLLVDFCREVGARAVVRGLRSQLDLAYEEPMARMNQHLAGIDTLFLLTDSAYSHISSSLVREVHGLGGDVSDMLPPPASLGALAAQRDVS